MLYSTTRNHIFVLTINQYIAANPTKLSIGSLEARLKTENHEH